MTNRDKHGRNANQMYEHYLTVPLYGGQTMGFPSPVDIALLIRTARHAALVMGYLDAFGPSAVQHLMDDDDNPGEYLRENLRALGFWWDDEPVHTTPPAPAPVIDRICRTKKEAVLRCRCKVDDANDCITCGARVWLGEDGPEHNCPMGFKQ